MNKIASIKGKIATRAKHPIQVVARRTGLSADVIRAWERRYHAVSPHRSATSRRLYSDEDVERLTLLRQATQAGRRIGDIAYLSMKELQELIQRDEAAIAQVPAGVRPGAGQTTRYHVNACLNAVQRLDAVALEAALAEATLALSLPVLLEAVIGPLLCEIGGQWRDGRLRPCHEHMATAQLRSFLGTLLVSGNMADTGPALIVATPAGQRHELGALMAAATAAQSGWRPLHLGPDIPSDEIAFAAMEKQAQAVALSIAYPADDARLPGVLRRLRRQLPEKIAILAGGGAAGGYEDALREIGALRLPDLAALRTLLDRMRAS